MRGRWLSLLVLAFPAAAAADGVHDGFVVERDNVEIAPAPQVTISSLEIDNRLGDITVIGRDAPGISLAVVKRAPDEEVLERLKVNLVPDPAGIVRISSALLVGQEARPIAAGTVRIDIQIYAPRAAAVKARAWNGKLGVTGMEAGADLAAHDGDIVVSNVSGPVTTTSMRGRQRLSDVHGPVTADDTYGDLALDEIRGASLAARVHRGTVTATRIRSHEVTITTTFGDIFYSGELAAGGQYTLRSYKGNVEARAAGSFDVDAVSRRSVASRLKLANPVRETNRITGRWGTAARPAKLTLQSTMGQVTFGLMND